MTKSNKMIGLTKLIKKVFVPDYKFKNLEKVAKNPGGLKKRAACRQGKLIDKQLTQTVSKIPNTILCKQTTLVLNKLKELNFTLTKSQVYVVNESLKLCTFIDLVALDETTQQEVIIEIKSGCHYRLCSTKNGFMKFQKEPTTNCLQNQHQLQALFGKYLYDKQFKTTTTCCLIYVNETQCDYIPLSQFHVEISNEAIETIRNLNHKKRKKDKKFQ